MPFSIVRCFSSSSGSLLRYKGKVAVITASTEGMGFAMAERLASEGAAIVVSSRKAEKVEAAVGKLRNRNYTVEGVVCHVSNAQQRKELLETAVKKFGGVDILINNAGVNPAFDEHTIMKTDERMWDKIFDVNVKAAWLMAKETYPLLKQRQGSNLLFVSSIGAFHGMRGGHIGAYATAKTSLLGLTKSIASELAADNIRVNCIAPGLITTPFSQTLTNTEEKRAEFVGNILLKRPAETHEVSSVVAFLCSDEASFITGETIVVAGGQASRL